MVDVTARTMVVTMVYLKAVVRDEEMAAAKVAWRGHYSADTRAASMVGTMAAAMACSMVGSTVA
jgi:hypothetical protein